MSDYNYYYDMTQERKLDSWTITKSGTKFYSCKCNFQCDEGHYVILVPYSKMSYSAEDDGTTPNFLELIIDGKTYSFKDDVESAYVQFRQGFQVYLQGGDHQLEIRLSFAQEKLDPAVWLNVNIIEDAQPVPAPVTGFRKTIAIPDTELPTAKLSEPDLTGYIPGCGCVNSPGRFGFSKGDGVLDCAMPALGLIDKLHVCGHPDYRKPHRWLYSTLPENATLHGSYYPAVDSIEQDNIAINHLSVNWATQFNNNDYSCTYSLATAGLITESTGDYMRLSKLEFAGNYQYCLIPGNGEAQIVSLDQLANGIKMTENFLLLFGSTEFPDLPLMITLDRTPEKMEVRYHSRTNRLTELIFHGCHRMITATPFGMEILSTISPDQQDMLADAVKRCRFWSHAFMAYPVKCEEYYKVDHDAEKVHIIQKFSYRYLTDEWNTTPLELAPLPPASSLNGTTETADDQDYNYPTKFGYLKGAYGNTSSYALPFMPVKRKFPLRDAKDSQPEELLDKCLDSYFQFTEHFSDRVQPYPFAGTLMEPFAYASSMAYFMKEEYRNKFRKYTAERLKYACDPARDYTYPVINWGYMMDVQPDDEQVKEIFADPALAHRHLWNWYERVEPFTNTKYHICYLNLGFFSSNIIKEGTREEIASLKMPLIENDWGVGLTFYYMNLCALASGDFAPIKENWELIKSVYKFFDSMHDWACMGTGYSDNAITWVEGANYGVFTGFINMAEAIGDQQEVDRGIYFAAKQLALRMSIVRSSIHYFWKMFHAEPWYITKSFREESNPSQQFQNVPKNFFKNRFRTGGVYNLTTEGIYPEIFEALRKFCPEDFSEIMNQLRDVFLTKFDYTNAKKIVWSVHQQAASMLTDEALDFAAPHQRVVDDVESAEKRNLLIKKWRGIHIFSRRLPEEYYKAQLLAWNNMKKHPLWMECWNGLVIDDAVCDGSNASVKFTLTESASPVIRFGCRKQPQRVALNGSVIPFKMEKADVFSVTPDEGGTLEILFD